MSPATPVCPIIHIMVKLAPLIISELKKRGGGFAETIKPKNVL